MTSITEHPQWPAVMKEQWEIEQVLGKVLNYPYYKDDLGAFPDATEADGVCVADHTNFTLAMEASKEIERLRKKCDAQAKILQSLTGINAPFICGVVGEPDEVGLADKILVCPAYGLDGFAIYKKETDYSAPGY